jgi:hypothetical protein
MKKKDKYKNMDNSIIQKELQKMIFVYNSILSGWTVRKLENNKFEFLRNINNENERQEIILEDYIKNFIKYNLNINNISKK